MTTKQAKQPAPGATSLPEPGVDLTTAPPWWLTKPDEIRAFLESLDGVTVEEIGRTAGGRPLIAAAWGELETLPDRTSVNLGSALGGGSAAAFYGQGTRRRQSIVFVGAAHGTEMEGTVAALNFLNIIATGKDLRGREHASMAEAGRRHRFVLIPVFNVDGRERALEHVHWINCNPDYHSMMTQGLTKDGEIMRWPTSKLVSPIPVDEMQFIGTYFNDAGINLVYDTPFGDDCQPETKALLSFCCRERPDVVILSHSNNGSLVEPPGNYLPAQVQARVAHLAAVVGMRCSRDGHAKRGIPLRPGYNEYQYYQSDGIYHASGALPVVIEFPCGWQNLPDNCDDILDIGLSVLDEISQFGTFYPFLPPHPHK